MITVMIILLIELLQFTGWCHFLSQKLSVNQTVIVCIRVSRNAPTLNLFQISRLIVFGCMNCIKGYFRVIWFVSVLLANIYDLVLACKIYLWLVNDWYLSSNLCTRNLIHIDNVNTLNHRILSNNPIPSLTTFFTRILCHVKFGLLY